MNLNEFLKKSDQRIFFDPIRIVNCIASSQPLLLFMSGLFARLKDVMQQQVVVCDVHTQTNTEIQAQLATSFLGESFIYGVMANTEPLKSFAAVQAYLETYEGCHLVIFCTQREHALRERDGVVHVTLEDTIDYATYRLLYKFFKQEDLTDTRFAQELFRRSPTVPLDSACLLMHYQLFVGKNFQQFFTHWFDRIIEPKHSLFSLSQYLFAKDNQRFYRAWSTVAEEYPPEFWIAFWSEQIWQALLFITIAKRDGALVAKKSVSRLPFSFMQKDWQKYSVETLTHAHDLLYQIDFANKNGAITEGLDLWYAKFLLS